MLGTPCKLSVGLDDAQVINPQPAPNGERVVFTHKTLSGPDELFTAPIHGDAPPVLLSPPGEYADFRAFTPDSPRVLYTQSIAAAPGSTACRPPAPRPRASGSPTTSASSRRSPSAPTA